jgi:hypothetical protein
VNCDTAKKIRFHMRSMRLGFWLTGTQDSESLRRGCFCLIGSCYRAAASPLSSSSRD